MLAENDLPAWVLRQFQKLVKEPAHAFLLSGPAGLNQFDLMMALAFAWLCDSPQGDGMACGHCESCHMLKAHTHPDLKVLLPQDLAITLNWDMAEPGSVDADGKKGKPSREIKTEALRNMIEFTQRTRARSRGQVVLIYPAERMNQVSANTLLKTLEEPTGETRFILATENAQRLLPTIRSRCQTHLMLWPTEHEALSWLELQGVQDAKMMLSAAGGRPAQAVQLVEQGIDAKRWAAIPMALSKGDVSAFEGMTPSQMVDVSSKLCHDLLAVSLGASPRFFAPDVLPFKVNRDTALTWSKELMQASRVAEHPWNVPLYTQALVGTAQKVLGGALRKRPHL